MSKTAQSVLIFLVSLVVPPLILLVIQPPARSAVGGFFGWIYYATPIELWAYASGNP